MSNPNTVTVYSPENEPFEMSRANARDLCNHSNWSMSPTGPVAPVAAPIAKEPADAVVNSEGSIEDAVPAEIEIPAETVVVEADEGEGEGETEVSEAPFTTDEEFAELTEREDVVAYLAKFFPDFRPHHKAGRDGLVAKAIELATA